MSHLDAGPGGLDTGRAAQPSLSDETRFQLGMALRAIYEKTCDAQPIPTAQVDLLLQLRHRERDLRRTD